MTAPLLLVLGASLALVSPTNASWEDYRAAYLEAHGATYIQIVGQDVLSAAESELQQRRIYLEAKALDLWEDAQPAATVVSVGYATGGCVIPCYVIECESSGDYLAENPYTTASGKYMFIDGTWANFGGYSHASDAPPAVQDEKARQVWANGAGASNWAQCL